MSAKDKSRDKSTQKKDKKDKKREHSSTSRSNSSLTSSKKQKVRRRRANDDDDDIAHDSFVPSSLTKEFDDECASSPTRIRIAGLTKTSSASDVARALNVDVARVAVGVWGTSGRGPKPPGGTAFVRCDSAKEATKIVNASANVRITDVDVSVTMEKEPKENEVAATTPTSATAAARPALFGGSQTPSTARAGNATASMTTPTDVRADDWQCAECAMTNFARRMSCFRCAAAKTAPASGGARAVVNTTAARAPTQGSAQDGYEVFLKFLPHSASEEEVTNYFADCGAIVGQARLLRDQLSGQSKGAGFVTFVDERGRAEALKRDGARFGGRNVSVTVAKKSTFGVRATEQAYGTHTPAMLAETVAALVAPDRSGVYVDGTFGRGGHSRGILAALSSEGRLHAFDMDPEAIKAGRELEKEDARFTIHHAPFGQLAQVLKKAGVRPAGIFLDLGISSPQFDDATRGFRPEQDGPLDLRFDVERGIPASEYLRAVPRDELRRVIHEFGETTDAAAARRISDAIVLAREAGMLPSTTKEFAALVARAKGKEYQMMHPAKLTFQALRIALNQEFDEMRRGLFAAFEIMPEHGRLGVLTWKHSECAILIDFYRDFEAVRDDFPLWRWAQSAHGDKCAKKLEKKWSIHMDDAQRPSEAETRVNSRSRSATLHILRKRDAVRAGDVERFAYKLKGWGKIPDPLSAPAVTFKYDV